MSEYGMQKGRNQDPNRRATFRHLCYDPGKWQPSPLNVRLLTFAQEHQSWRWKHWLTTLSYIFKSVILIMTRGCVTPQQVSNLKASTEGDPARYLDGYEDLDEHEQAKIAKAIEDGHVADDDWNGVSPVDRRCNITADIGKDVEMNREGQKGFRTPASKKKARDEAKAAVSSDTFRRRGLPLLYDCANCRVERSG